MVRQLSNGGGKHHRKGKNSNLQTRELLFKEDGQDYGLITNMLGNRRCYVKTYNDDIERIGVIRGNMKKSTSRVCNNDLVLISLRDFQDNKVDIIHVFKQDEVKSLIRYEEIDDKFINNGFDDEIDSQIVFSDDIDNI